MQVFATSLSTQGWETAVTDGEFVRLEVEGGIATIRLDRPPMNALNAQVQEELRAAAIEAGDRSDVSRGDPLRLL